MSFKFGKRSLKELVGVHPYLSFFAMKTLEESTVDFGVVDGVRTLREQQKLLRRGVSKTTKSYHLYGLAVDLVPYINGRYVWDGAEADQAFERIHMAGHIIIDRYNLPIENGFDKWGWDRPHWQMTGWKKKYDVRKLI
jgi:peptidoglycan L-alanyl-D-glutamate endopeptidase CwlK